MAIVPFQLLATFFFFIATPLCVALHLPQSDTQIYLNILAAAILLIPLPWLNRSRSQHAGLWYLPRILGGVPWALLPGNSPLTQSLQLLHLLNAIYLPLLPPLTHKLDHFSPWMRTLRRLGLSLFAIGILAHWVSCGWIALKGVPTDGSPLETYTTSLYWSITTMATVGYGDIVAHTLPQRLFAIGVMLLGIGFFGYIVGNIASFLASVDRMGTLHRERMEQIRTYMRFHHFPRPLRLRIEEYFNYIHEHRLGFDDEHFIKDLPNSLRADVAVFRHRHVLRKVPFLRAADSKVIERLAFTLKPLLLRPHDLVFRRGDQGDRMYFINRGSVEILSIDDQNIVAVLQEGSFFGEMALINQEVRNATVRTQDFCELVYLEHSALKEVMKRFPDFSTEIERIARERALV